ncbi:hypothetical protein R3P38DRAFT_2776184 [Favolaschia claudopus]|uniref:Uncharacterized protein n=1 Tax=Favolaschia claudopus TaxID=2862362 RepID=A0AAW0BPU1_9AGAR
MSPGHHRRRIVWESMFRSPGNVSEMSANSICQNVLRRSGTNGGVPSPSTFAPPNVGSTRHERPGSCPIIWVIGRGQIARIHRNFVGWGFDEVTEKFSCTDFPLDNSLRTIHPLHPPFPFTVCSLSFILSELSQGFWPPAGKPRPRRVKQRPRLSFITSDVVRRRGAALSILSRVFGRRQANTSPDAYSSVFHARPPSFWLLPASAPRYSIDTTYRRTASGKVPMRSFGRRQAKARPRPSKQRIPRLFYKFFDACAVAAVAVALRSGALTPTRCIDVPRAGLQDIGIYGKFFLTSVIQFSELDLSTFATQHPHQYKNFPLRGRHHQHQVPKSKFDFSELWNFFFPLRGPFLCQQHPIPQSKFEIPRSRVRDFELSSRRFVFFPLRGAQFNDFTPNSLSPKTQFSPLRGIHAHVFFCCAGPTSNSFKTSSLPLHTTPAPTTLRDPKPYPAIPLLYQSLAFKNFKSVSKTSKLQCPRIST